MNSGAVPSDISIREPRNYFAFVGLLKRNIRVTSTHTPRGEMRRGPEMFIFRQRGVFTSGAWYKVSFDRTFRPMFAGDEVLCASLEAPNYFGRLLL